MSKKQRRLTQFGVHGLLAVALLATLTHLGRAVPPAEGAPGKPVPADTSASSGLAEDLAFLRKEIREVRSEIRHLGVEVKLLAAKEKGVPDLSDVDLAELVEKDSQVQRLAALLNAREAEERNIEERFAKPFDDRVVEAARKGAKEAEAKLADRRVEVRAILLKAHKNEAAAKVRAKRLEVEERIAALKDLEKELTDEAKQLEDKLGAGKDADEAIGKRLSRMEDEIRQLKTSLDELKELVKKGLKKE
jgi:chromosome segregation ATPase